eukprot:s3135_g5.t1
MVFGKLNEESESKLSKVARRLQAVMRPNQKKARPMCRKEQKDSEEPAELEPVPAEDDDCIMLVDDDEPEPHELLQEEPALQEGQTEATGRAASLVDVDDDEPAHSGQDEPSLMEGQTEAIEPLAPQAGDDHVVVSDDEVGDDPVGRAAETAPKGVISEPSCAKDTAVSDPQDKEAFVVGSEAEDETRPESSGQDEMVSWPGERAEMHPNPHPFRRCDTSCSSILIDSPVKVRVAKSCDEFPSALLGSCASLEGALQSLSLSPATGTTEALSITLSLPLSHFLSFLGQISCRVKTKQFQHGQVAAASRSQTPQPKLVIDKYPAIKPPAADFLEKVELETSTADPPPYNANGQQAGKKRRRRGKQNENGKKQKVACDDEDGDEDCDEGGARAADLAEAYKKAATKPPAAKKNKAKEAAKPPAQKPSSKGKAAKKSDPPVPEPIKEKDKDDSGEPIKEKKQGKDGDREPIKENKQGKNGDGGDASIPSLEEVKAKGGFAPVRQQHLLKCLQAVVEGEQRCRGGQEAGQAKKATEDAKAKGKTADEIAA